MWGGGRGEEGIILIHKVNVFRTNSPNNKYSLNHMSSLERLPFVLLSMTPTSEYKDTGYYPHLIVNL